jgi:hypothetical protein
MKTAMNKVRVVRVQTAFCEAFSMLCVLYGKDLTARGVKGARSAGMSVLAVFSIISVIFMFFAFPVQAVDNASRYAENSVLASGKWFQMRITENAVYRLTYEDIKNAGISDPAKVRIYGYGGWILNENFTNFTQSYIDDLPEVAVWMSKGTDGIFNAGDFLLFYGRGTVKWTYNKSSDLYEHENNPYTTYATYFLTEGVSGPRIMEEINVPASSSTTVNFTSFDDYLLHEVDEKELIFSGRMLFGENFIAKNSRSFSFSIPGITSETGRVRVAFAGAPPKGKTSLLSVSVDNSELLSLPVVHPSLEYQSATLVNGSANWLGEKNEQTTLTVRYGSEEQAIAYLDYIVIQMKRRLQSYDTGYTFFRNRESLSAETVKYSIENAGAPILVWDITDNYDVKSVKTTVEGNSLTFTASPNNVLHEYVMIDFSKPFPVPVLMNEVNNQNLHGMSATDYVIIAPEVYAAQAEELAGRHRRDGLKVAVVRPEWIYNEFSSGTPDATAYRRFMKMFYDRAVTEDEKPQYLLLFGDGFFDNRFLTSIGKTLDSRYYLLTFQMVESINESYSYGTDDYFGFLDDGEGVTLYRDGVDIGIGRFPVTTVTQAQNAVNKVIGYMDGFPLGEWKNRVISTADNADTKSSPVHATQANKIADYIETNHPQYMITKSYMDAFKQVDLNGKTTFPDAKKKFLSTLNSGCFLLNYTGHGNRSNWSAEDMLNIMDVRQMNFEGLPLWITATCDFGWFDCTTVSGAEEAFLNRKGGAIALFTTSRVVYSSNNYVINDKLVRNIFSNVNGKRPRLGDIARKSKNDVGADSNKLNYVLLGDPGMMLNYPELHVQLERINGEMVDESQTNSFRTLESVLLEGSIRDEAGNVVTDFNGTLKMTLFDGKQEIKAVSPSPDGSFFTFYDYPSRIFSGEQEVTGGRFSVSLTVPLDIAYTDEKGKINFYAYDEGTGRDANGYYMNFLLAASDDNVDTGNGAPEIRQLFLNSESFRNGDSVNETPFFFARVYDAKGINMSGNGLGHTISVCIDNSALHTYSLNSWYVPDGNEGEVRFSIPELSPGQHRLVFKVWNILNRSTSDTLHFNVVKGLRPALYDVTATRIPARDYTSFRLVHDRPESVIDVELSVCDLTGRTVWTYSETGSSSWLKEYEIEWDLTDNSGKRVEQGVYVYRAVINASEGREATKAKKIVVLRQ